MQIGTGRGMGRTRNVRYPGHMAPGSVSLERAAPFDIPGGGGLGFFRKKCFVSLQDGKNKMSSTKLRIKSLFFIQ